MSNFLSLYTALSGLRAAQTGLQVTADNVANVGTPGRTRQRVDLAVAASNYLPIGTVGGGVDITGVTRARDTFLDLQARESGASLGRISARADVLYRLESLFVGEGDGIAPGLHELWGAFEDLANDPSDAAARTTVIGTLDNLVSRIRTAASGIDMVARHTSAEIETTVGEVNSLLEQLGHLNSQIFAARVEGATPNALLDQRDLVVDQLSALAGVRASEDERGMMRVSSGGVTLVDGTTVRELSLEADGITITTPSGMTLNPGGSLGGLTGALVDDLPTHRERLDDFVRDLAAALNAAHAAGFTPSGAAGGDLLAFDALAPAATLATVVADPDEIAAAADPAAEPFDGGNAAALGALRFDEVGAGGTLTLDDQFRQFVVTLGSETSSALAASDSQEALWSAVETSRTNTHGVSADEEMVMLMNYQRSYEAAARVMTVIDETLEVLVNRLGVAGR